MFAKLHLYPVSLLLFLLSYIVPKKKGRLLFGAGYGIAFRGNPKYLYLYLSKNKYKYNFKYSWVTKNKKLYENLRASNLPSLFLYTPRAFWTILRSEIIIIDSSIEDFSFIHGFFGRFSIIQTWHGTPLKKIRFDTPNDKSFGNRIVRFFWHIEFKKYLFIPTTSKEVTEKFKTSFLTENIEITGYPRNDVLLDKTILFQNLDKKLNFAKYSKIISYIPTFRDVEIQNKPFTLKGLKVLNQHLKDKNSLLIFKKHPLEKNIPNLSGFSNIKDYSEQIGDVQELLVHTDILITDYSSVFFDFCLTNKPIIYYPYDYKEYIKDCRDMYYDYYKELIGPFAHNQEELLELIKTSDNWFKDKGYQKKYNRFKKKFNKYLDGNSSERVFKILEKKV